MQQTIADILNKSISEISLAELMYCMEKVKDNGDVCLIKLDGERKLNHYTVLISFIGIKAEMIRADEATLISTLTKVLIKYIEVRSGS